VSHLKDWVNGVNNRLADASQGHSQGAQVGF